MLIQGNNDFFSSKLKKKSSYYFSIFLQFISRWVGTLNSNDVADRIVLAVRRNEKMALIPWYFSFMLAFKYIFPWGCTSGFLRRLVPDATPQHILPSPVTTPSIQKQDEMNFNNNNNINNNNIDKETELIKRMSTAIDGERVL